MKKTFTLLAIAALFLSCGKQLSPMQQVAMSDPIMPVMLPMDSVSIFFTDYVPTLAADGFDRVWLDKYDFNGQNGQLDLFIPNMFYSADRRYVHILTFVRNSECVSVPVLPPTPRRQAMYLKAIDEKNITVAFTEVPKKCDLRCSGKIRTSRLVNLLKTQPQASAYYPSRRM